MAAAAALTMALLGSPGAQAERPMLRAKCTTYCPYCSGTTCADGSHVRRGTCAASPNVPMHSRVWVEGVGVLLVTDRGGAVKARRPYTRRGESAVIDIWVPR